MNTQSLVNVLTKAIEIANQSKADNFDLETFTQVLDEYIDELKEIKQFEIYDED